MQQELINVVVLNNQLVLVGLFDMGQGCFLIKVFGIFEMVVDVFSLFLKFFGEGVVMLFDVVEIWWMFKDWDCYVWFNGKFVVVVEVVKCIGVNIIEMNLVVCVVVVEE